MTSGFLHAHINEMCSNLHLEYKCGEAPKEMYYWWGILQLNVKYVKMKML